MDGRRLPAACEVAGREGGAAMSDLTSERDPYTVADLTERSLIGAIWTDPMQAAQVRSIVGPEHFHNPVLAQVYRLSLDLLETGKPLDVALVLDAAQRGGASTEITADLLADLMLACEAPSRAPELAQAIRRQARDRDLRQELEVMHRETTKANGNLADVIRKQASRLVELTEPRAEAAPLNAAQLCQKFPTLREPVIDGLLRRSEVGNLVAPPKAHKSHALLHLAVCVATGRKWLGFPTVKGRVLLMDYELHGETLGQRLPLVLAAEGLTPDNLGDSLAVELLRGRPLDINTVADYFAKVGPGRYSLIVLDPLYRLFPGDMDENDNADIAKVYTLLAGYADKLNSAMIVVHHLSKGDQSGKGLTDLGAGGGAQSRVADAHLSLREHAEPEAAVLAGVVRSFPAFEPIALRWEYPLWQLAPDLDPAKLKRAPGRNRDKDKATEASPDPWTEERFAGEFLTAEPKHKAAILADAEKPLGNRNRAVKMLDAAESKGLAYRWKLRRDKRTYYANGPQLTEEGDR